MLDAIAAPFAYEFMQKAVLVGGVVGALCALLSPFVTLRGWSLLGDALSHAVVPGVAVAGLIGAPFIAGAGIAALLAVGAIGAVQDNARLRPDAVIGVVFTAFFAAGLLIVSVWPSNLRVTSILFGDLLGIADRDIAQVLAVGALCLVVVALKWRDLRHYCFDPQHARSVGLPTRLLHGTLLVMLSLATVATLQAVGALLVVAMLITPGAIATLLTDRFGRMLVIAPAVGAATSMAGAYGSYFLDGSAGGIIVSLQTGLFLLAFLFAPRHGWLATRRRASA